MLSEARGQKEPSFWAFPLPSIVTTIKSCVYSVLVDGESLLGKV